LLLMGNTRQAPFRGGRDPLFARWHRGWRAIVTLFLYNKFGSW